MSTEPATATRDYAERLVRLQEARWKRLFDVQAPYRWHIRRLDLGRVLDVGCGIGRNLVHLGGNGVGIDHNAEAVAVARGRGLTAYTVEDWAEAGEAEPGAFDSLLLAHVIEHVTEAEASEILDIYLPFVRKGGKIVLITPQERGFASDATHVRFTGFREIKALCAHAGLRIEIERSFPFPRFAGRFLRYNEFVVVAQKP